MLCGLLVVSFVSVYIQLNRNSTRPVAGFSSVYMKLWGTLCAMAREPHPQLAQMAADIIAYVSNQVHYTILQYIRNYYKK